MANGPPPPPRENQIPHHPPEQRLPAIEQQDEGELHALGAALPAVQLLQDGGHQVRVRRPHRSEDDVADAGVQRMRRVKALLRSAGTAKGQRLRALAHRLVEQSGEVSEAVVERGTWPWERSGSCRVPRAGGGHVALHKRPFYLQLTVNSEVGLMFQRRMPHLVTSIAWVRNINLESCATSCLDAAPIQVPRSREPC